MSLTTGRAGVEVKRPEASTPRFSRTGYLPLRPLTHGRVLADSVSHHMRERRAFPRIPGVELPWLSAVCVASSVPAALVNISDSGALIQCESRLIPGDRRPLELKGSHTTRVAARILRVEVVQISPQVTYRAAVSFVNPVNVDQLWHGAERFEQGICRLLPVETARVTRSLSSRPGTESIYFDIPDGSTIAPRYLQLFFAPGTALDRAQFELLKDFARAAARLPHEY